MLASSPRRPFPPDHKHKFRPGAAADGEAGRYDKAFFDTERHLAEIQEQAKRERQLAGVQWATLVSHPPAPRLVMGANHLRLPRAPSPDAADALAIALCHARMTASRAALALSQRERP